MYLNDRIAFLGGLAFILIAACTIVIVAMTATSTGEEDPFERKDVPQFLEKLNDNEEQVFVGIGASILSDGVLVLVASVAFFVLFRDRSFGLATLGMLALIATATLSLVNDFLTIMSTMIAADYVKGGADGVAAGDPATLELGRFVGVAGFVLFNVLNTTFGVGMVAIGTLLARAPRGAVNPPRWLGWVAIVSGVSSELAWLVVAGDVFFIFFPLGGLTSLIVFFGLGGWLIARGGQPVASTSFAPAAA